MELNEVFHGVNSHQNTANLSKIISLRIPDSKIHGTNMGPIWGRQDPGGPHVGPMNFAIWDSLYMTMVYIVSSKFDPFSISHCYALCNTAWCRNNMVNFHPNPHKRHPIAHPWGWDIGCLLWILPPKHILPQSLLYHGWGLLKLCSLISP